jgi:ABC-type lipoprotein release transport system permease subunit
MVRHGGLCHPKSPGRPFGRALRRGCGLWRVAGLSGARQFWTGAERLPLDITQSAHGLAIVLTTLGAIAASILPARAAARLDPVTAIGQ